MVTVSAALGDRLSLEIFAFIVGDLTQAIEESKFLAGD